MEKNKLNDYRNCRFCRIIEENKKEITLFRDKEIVIFYDIRPKSRIHLLAIPLTHIKDIRYLDSSHLDLLTHMRNKSIEYISENFGSQLIFNLGFHIPPKTSVNHLHLHIVVLPILKKRNINRYTPNTHTFKDIDILVKEILTKQESSFKKNKKLE